MSWTKRCYNFISYAPGMSNRTDLTLKEHTCWVQAVMKQKLHVTETDVSTQAIWSKAGLYCPGMCLFRAGIQTAPPSWHFCSPYQQPTSSDPALDNITTNNVWEITLLHFLGTFIFQEENLHTTVPTLASCNPGPSLSPSRFTNFGYNFISKRKLGTWWPVPGTELSEMWINWRKSKTEQQEGPEDTIYKERKKEWGLFSLEDRWLWTSNTRRTERNGLILSQWLWWTVEVVTGLSCIKDDFGCTLSNTFLCLLSKLACGGFLPRLLKTRWFFSVVDLHLVGVRGLSLPSLWFFFNILNRTNTTLVHQCAFRYGKSPHVERSLGIRAHYHLGTK